MPGYDQLLKEWWPVIVWGGLGLLVLIGVGTSFYTVQPEERAVVKRFGKVVSIREPGLHFKLPFWIDRAWPVPTERVLKEEFGFRTTGTGTQTAYSKGGTHEQESLMLTGDLNVIDVEWVVQYRISDPDKYLHRVREQQKAIRDISESVMRRIVGNRLGSDVLTVGRVEVATQTRDEIQQILDDFDMGVHIYTVEMQDVTPPDPVKPAFNEVNEARQEKERLINEAEKRRNQAVPRAQGEAQQQIAEAEGYAFERTNIAKGEASRFAAVLTEYLQAPDVTRRRLYLEMIDKVLPKIGRLYVVQEGQAMPIPLLNLFEGMSPAGARPQAAGAARQEVR
jgi:membrane protease subunit HflK